MIPMPSETECTMVLIRHGATENNQANPPILQGRGIDCGLSPSGREQAQAAALALAPFPIQRVYASPLIRAQETASSIAKPHSQDVETIDQITEVDVGDWETRSWVNIEKEDPEEYQAFISNPEENGYMNGESLKDVHQRVVPALQTALESNLGKLIVVVAHNVVNRVFLAEALDLPIRAAREISQDNCGINIIKLQNGKLKLKTLNATLHLSTSST